MLLHPKDLLNLSRANKNFRRTLYSPAMNTMWKAKREEFEGPEPPSNYTEAKWFSFLFNTTCMVSDAARLIMCDAFDKYNCCTELWDLEREP